MVLTLKLKVSDGSDFSEMNFIELPDPTKVKSHDKDFKNLFP